MQNAEQLEAEPASTIVASTGQLVGLLKGCRHRLGCKACVSTHCSKGYIASRTDYMTAILLSRELFVMLHTVLQTQYACSVLQGTREQTHVLSGIYLPGILTKCRGIEHWMVQDVLSMSSLWYLMSPVQTSRYHRLLISKHVTPSQHANMQSNHLSLHLAP